MKKTLIAAAALLTLGVGSAFADGNVNAQPPAPQVSQSATQQASGQHRLFSASTRPHTTVYSSFGFGGGDGGEQ
jgi:hypothetical protein